MRTALVLAATTIVMQCDISDVSTETLGLSVRYYEHETKNSNLSKRKTESNLGLSLPEINFSDTTETVVGKLRPSKGKQKNVIYKLMETAMRVKNHYPNLDNSVFKTNSGRGEGKIVGQNDTVLSETQAEQLFKEMVSGPRSKRQVLKDSSYPSTKWQNGVFYTFNTSEQSVQRGFEMGVKVWSDYTCINFIEDRSAYDKVVVVKEGGCWSGVGRLGGEQYLSLNENPTEGSAVHEIGHVLGLLHTMSRYDRDNFIKIVMQNVDPRVTEDFEKNSENESDVYGLTYDYGSVMHYDELSGSINRKPTMIAIDENYQKTMGSELISFSDIFVINEHYGCNVKCKKSTSAKCMNEGFPHPRNCSICICPSGYGGSLCDQRPPGCGKDLIATRGKQMVNCSLGYGTDLRDQFHFCHYMISAPEGTKIEIEVLSISYGYDKAGCPRGGIEIKAQKDQKMTGYRFCSTKGTEKPIVSRYNHLPVILFNKFGTMHLQFTYRYIV